MSFSRLFSPGAMSRFSTIGADVAINPGALKALDSQLLTSAKKVGPVSKFRPAYAKYIGRPANISSTMLYGGKYDTAKLMTALGGSYAGIRYGGEASRPLYNYLTNIATGINGEAMASYGKSLHADGVSNIFKPGLALTSKPAMALDSALDGALHLSDHPILASLAIPVAAYGALKGGSALLSRLGRAKRLTQLQKGIAPRAYRQQARQLGFK